MSTDARTTDLQTIEALLAELAKRVDGAVDFWTLVCLSEEMASLSPGFLTKQFSSVRALIADIVAACGRLGPAHREVVPLRLARLAAVGDRLEQAFNVMARYRDVPRDELRAATDTLADTYAEVRNTVLQFGQVLGIDVS